MEIEGEITIKTNEASFTLKKGITPERIWIERADGEGGDFSIKDILNLIDKYYCENF
jgi:hypothetical protein